TEYFDMGPPPDLSVVTFRCRQDAVSNAGATEDLLRAIHADGRIYLTSTQLGGRFTLRLAILNASTHREHIDRAIDVLTELAASAAS
ncbi:MAG: aspartate aminotransferase family protein, partial [Acidimicrobiia bacterium]|nr:aspartate aminotransferase family protein [Acidimicrobiia bacterium]